MVFLHCSRYNLQLYPNCLENLRGRLWSIDGEELRGFLLRRYPVVAKDGSNLSYFHFRAPYPPAWCGVVVGHDRYILVVGIFSNSEPSMSNVTNPRG